MSKEEFKMILTIANVTDLTEIEYNFLSNDVNNIFWNYFCHRNGDKYECTRVYSLSECELESLVKFRLENRIKKLKKI